MAVGTTLSLTSTCGMESTQGIQAQGALLPCTHVTRVQHEDATRGLCLTHDWSKGKMVLVQGDLQGLAAAADEEKGPQEPHALHEHLLGEGRDTL